MKKGYWYDTTVDAAQKAGIVQGVGEGRFAPEASISREEMAVMVMRAYTYLSAKHLSDDTKGAIASFRDADRISSSAKEAVLAAQAEGFIDGIDASVFSPKTGASREQVAAILIRLLEKAGKL